MKSIKLNGITYRQCSPEAVSGGLVTALPILPTGLPKEALLQNHDVVHVQATKDHSKLVKGCVKKHWVNMPRDVEHYCSDFSKCQLSKPTAPTRAPLISVPIGQPWPMVAVDVLPLSFHNNLLVDHDYFTPNGPKQFPYLMKSIMHE